MVPGTFDTESNTSIYQIYIKPLYPNPEPNPNKISYISCVILGYLEIPKKTICQSTWAEVVILLLFLLTLDFEQVFSHWVLFNIRSRFQYFLF